MKILFQGDNITDAGRDQRNYHHLGNGYPKYAAEMIREAHPNTNGATFIGKIYAKEIEPLLKS